MSNPFDKPASTPTLSFSNKDEYGRAIPKPFGTKIGGILAKDPEVVQSRGYEGPLKDKPLFWSADAQGVKTDQATTPDGRTNNAVQQIVMTFAGAGPEGVDAALWCSFYPKDMFEAIQEALGDNAPQKGDELWVTITGLRPISGKAPAYTYSAVFTKRAGAFATVAATQAASPPPPPAAGTTTASVPPAPPAPVAEPVLSNGYTASALKAAGWSDEQVAALAAPAPAGPPAPPAAPQVPAADKMANLSDEDKKMLNLA